MRVGLCGGIFDLFHKGHREFIRRAGKGCEVLLIAVGSDWITRAQKGAGRPIEGQYDRAAAVRRYCKRARIRARVFVTDLLDFRGYNFVDIFFVGEGLCKMYPPAGAEIKVLPRTDGVSTTLEIKRRGFR